MRPSSTRQILFAIPCLCLAAAVLGCGEEEGVDPDAPGYHNRTLGVEVYGTDPWLASTTVLEDGSTEMFGDLTVSIDGQGSHTIQTYALVDSVANGARRTFATTDLETGTERVFHYDVQDNAVVIGDFDGGVFVYGNPDGTYDVVAAEFDAPASEDQYAHAANGYEAYQLVSDFNEFSSTSPHSLMLAVVMGTAPLAEARTIWSCVQPNCPKGATGGGADPPTVCTLFPEFCTCVGCHATGSDAAECEPCPR